VPPDQREHPVPYRLEIFRGVEAPIHEHPVPREFPSQRDELIPIPQSSSVTDVTTKDRDALAELHAELATLPWTREAIAAALKAAAQRHKLKPAQIMMPLRVLVAGTTATPAIDAVLALLGRAVTRARIASGLERSTS